MRTASTTAKPCQEDSSKFYLITGIPDWWQQLDVDDSRILFRGNGECRMSDINETQEIDLGDNQIDSVYKVQIEVVYPTFDPNILWDKMEPMLVQESKKLALFNHEGGLIEHYGKLYQYRQAILDSKLGFTCRLDVDEFSNGFVYFKRIYICFKGVKDGWLAGCWKDYLMLWEIGYQMPSTENVQDKDWVFFPSDQSYGVNLQNKVCACRMWELSDVLCVHVVASRGVIGSGGSSGIGDGSGGSGGRGDGSGGGMGGIIGRGCGNTSRGGGNTIKGGGNTRKGGGTSKCGGTSSRGGRSRRGGRMARTLTSDGHLTTKEEYQLELDEHDFRESMEEYAITEARIAVEKLKLDRERREEQKWEDRMDYFNPAN
ncbi:calcium/proton exchanger [Tanacetum coccineum]